MKNTDKSDDDELKKFGKSGKLRLLKSFSRPWKLLGRKNSRMSGKFEGLTKSRSPIKGEKVILLSFLKLLPTSFQASTGKHPSLRFALATGARLPIFPKRVLYGRLCIFSCSGTPPAGCLYLPSEQLLDHVEHLGFSCVRFHRLI